MSQERPWWKRIEDKLALASYWDEHGLMLTVRAASLFALPIEGGFWLSVMGEPWWFCAYALPFTLDWLADVLVYKFGRIQLSVNKGTKKWRISWWILVFVVFNAVQSWGTSAWQLNNIMRSNGNLVHWAFPMLFATIQPLMGAGAAVTKAVEDGKFDEPEKGKPEQVRIKGKPDHAWWVTKLESLNGNREQITTERVRELCLAEYTTPPSGTTLYNWAKESKGYHPQPVGVEASRGE